MGGDNYEKKYTDYAQERDRMREQAMQDVRHDQKALDWLINDNIKDKGDLLILDLGCADGHTTKERFAPFEYSIHRVIGVDFLKDKIEKAQKIRKQKFSFFAQDIEAKSFEAFLQSTLASYNRTGFDIVFGAFILVCLKDAQGLLKTLYNYVAEDGFVVFRESDDSGKISYPNEKGELETIIKNFNELSKIEEPFFAKKIPFIYSQAGFKPIKCIYYTIDTLDKDFNERMEIFWIAFNNRRSKYDILSDEEQQANKQTLDALKKAFNDMEDSFASNIFYYAETKYIFIGKKQ